MNSLHYPSLELCKKLTEAGFPRTEHLFLENLSGSKIYSLKEYEHKCIKIPLGNSFVCPSVMEILDIIPQSIGSYALYIINMDKNSEKKWFSVFYRDEYGRVEDKVCAGFSLPNALAEMYLWLKENNYLTK